MSGVSVASFNIHWGRRPRTYEPFDVVEDCRQLDADVLALQEVWRTDGRPSVAADVADALGYQLHEVWTARADVEPRCRIAGLAGEPAGTGDWGQALLTRVPRGPVVDWKLSGFLFDVTERVVMTTEVEVDGGAITVCASHLPHLEHVSPLLRWRLRPMLPDTDQPAVFMGDFNMWRWVTKFVVPGWKETARAATWPARLPTFQIDHLLTTPPVAVHDAEVVPLRRSDHLPIKARLSVR